MNPSIGALSLIAGITLGVFIAAYVFPAEINHPPIVTRTAVDINGVVCYHTKYRNEFSCVKVSK